jgi:hypothetical protein
MASYQSNQSGKAKARAWLGADYLGETVRLKEEQSVLKYEFKDALEEAVAEQKRIEQEKADARTDENDSFGEYFWEGVQLVTSLAAGFGTFLMTGDFTFSTAFMTYAALQEVEEGWYDYAESEALNDVDTSHLTEMIADIKSFDWDLGKLDQKYAKLNSTNWETDQDIAGDRAGDDLQTNLDDFQSYREGKDQGRWYDFAGNALVDAGTSAAKTYMASYLLPDITFAGDGWLPEVVKKAT